MTNRIKHSTQRNVIRNERVRLVLDSSRFVIGETPTPATDGAQTVFTCANAYVSGTLEVIRGNLVMHPTTDVSETSADAGTFTMVVAPDSDESIIVNYIKQ